MRTPGDYYAAKRKEALELRDELRRHQLTTCSGKQANGDKCRVCKHLEALLEQAMYVGD